MKTPLFYIAPLFKHPWSYEWHELTATKEREPVFDLSVPSEFSIDMLKSLSGEFAVGFFADKKTKVISHCCPLWNKQMLKNDVLNIKWSFGPITGFSGMIITTAEIKSILSPSAQRKFASVVCSRRIGLVQPTWMII